MSMVRFDPFADLLTNGRWVPAVDIFENGQQELVLKAELPDMKREDIAVVSRRAVPPRQEVPPRQRVPSRQEVSPERVGLPSRLYRSKL